MGMSFCLRGECEIEFTTHRLFMPQDLAIVRRVKGSVYMHDHARALLDGRSPLPPRLPSCLIGIRWHPGSAWSHWDSIVLRHGCHSVTVVSGGPAAVASSKAPTQVFIAERCGGSHRAARRDVSGPAARSRRAETKHQDSCTEDRGAQHAANRRSSGVGARVRRLRWHAGRCLRGG